MKRKQLKVMGLSYSQSQIGSYVVVLSEKKGNTKIPVIIKPGDAQNIAVKLENIKVARPLTHDIMKSMTDMFQIDVFEVFIYGLVEGMFYAKLLATNGAEDVEIECSIGDAIALSLVYKCPIWIKTEILEQVESKTSIGDLEKLMESAIANEEYEIAAEIRDRISKLKDQE